MIIDVNDRNRSKINSQWLGKGVRTGKRRRETHYYCLVLYYFIFLKSKSKFVFVLIG